MRGSRAIRRWSHVLAAVVVLLAATGLFVVSPASAFEAGLRVCNNSDEAVGVALGTRGERGWQSKGWTEIVPGDCAALIEDRLIQDYYYLYATDGTGGAWQGNVFLCSRGRDFEILGTGDCIARGYSRTPFFEVETYGAKKWTVILRPWTALYAATPPLSSAWTQTRPDEAARHQLYEIVTSSVPAAPLQTLLSQSGGVEFKDRRQVVELVEGYQRDLPRALATELRVWFRETEDEPVAERLSFYDNGRHLVTVVRTPYGFALGIDPGR
jgi:uncharacterized membrane protein